MTEDLFHQPETQHRYYSLAERLRPRHLHQVEGQEHLLGEGAPLRQAIASGALHSMILWGPPGSGKTALARLLAEAFNARFEALSAVLAGVQDVRAVLRKADLTLRNENRPSLLFLDEIHRFNKAQQDIFLPFLEQGQIFLVGATTENPAFSLNNALLSRLRLYVLKPLAEDVLGNLIDRALNDAQEGLGAMQLQLEPAARSALAVAADGDGRRVLLWLEAAAQLAGTGGCIDMPLLKRLLQQGLRRFDRRGDIFYEQISALHKSVRGSSPDAALYWLTRMLDGGCDPAYIGRRLLRMASEDVGNADPQALSVALSAWQVWDRLGSPEGELALAQCAVYLACTVKSNALYLGFKKARADVSQHGTLEVPIALRNAPTRLHKSLGYGRGYRYPHDEADGFAAGVHYFPDSLGDRQYYNPLGRGAEKAIAERLQNWRQRHQECRSKDDGEPSPST